MIILDAFGHLYTTDDIYELAHFATIKLGLKEEWNHCSRFFPHWDLTTRSMKSKAFANGAIKPSGHSDNHKYIVEAEAYAKGLLSLEEWRSVLYRSTGLVDQPIMRVNYPKLFEILESR